MASLPDSCNGIIAEIGPDNFFTIKSLSLSFSRGSGGSSAQCTIELPSSVALPQPPKLVAIISTDRSKIYFNGLYLSQSLNFKDGGLTREYNLTFQDLFVYTRKLVITGYHENVTLPFHLSNLMIRGGVLRGGFHVFSPGFFATESFTGGVSFDPNNDPIDFAFESGYLDEALNKLAQQTNFVWTIENLNWRPGNLAGSGVSLGIIRFIQNNIQGSPTPKNPLIIPEVSAIICPDMFWYESVNFSNTAGTVSEILCFGKNGRPNSTSEVELDPGAIIQPGFSREDIIAIAIEKDSTATTFPYPDQATYITGVRVVAND